MAGAGADVYRFFRQRGLTPAQAAGIVGNTQQESGNDPNAAGGGLIQGQGGRTSRGTLRQQLEGVWGELNGPERGTLQALRGAHDPKTAARIFSQRFERPGEPMLSKREQYALDALHAFGGMQTGQAAPGAAQGRPGQQTVSRTVSGASPVDLAGVLEAVKGLAGPGVVAAQASPAKPAFAAGPTLPAGARSPAPLQPVQQGPSDVQALLAKLLAPGPTNVESKVRQEPGAPAQAPARAASIPRGKGTYGVLATGGLQFAGADQGLDFTGHGHLLAPADLKITKVSSNSGWPGGGLIVGQIQSGPERGHYIYFAEAVKPHGNVRQGALVRRGEPVAEVNSPYPGSEIGFAQDASGTAFGSVHDGKPGGPAPVHGQRFARYLQRVR